MNATEKLEMQVEEDKDGSAIVSLPDNIKSPDHRDDGDDGDDDIESHANGGPISSDDPDREQIRAARREERNLKKKLQKAKISESNHLINSLKRQNEAMAERLAALEKRSQGKFRWQYLLLSYY